MPEVKFSSCPCHGLWCAARKLDIRDIYIHRKGCVGNRLQKGILTSLFNLNFLIVLWSAIAFLIDSKESSICNALRRSLSNTIEIYGWFDLNTTFIASATCITNEGQGACRFTKGSKRI